MPPPRAGGIHGKDGGRQAASAVFVSGTGERAKHPG